MADDDSDHAATEDVAVLLSLSNVSATGCQLDGYPRVTLIGDGGAPFNVTAEDGHGMVINSKPSAPVGIAPGGAAYLLVEKHSCLAQTTSTDHTVAIVLPGTSRRLETPTSHDFEICTASDPIANVINLSPVVASPAVALNG